MPALYQEYIEWGVGWVGANVTGGAGHSTAPPGIFG
jgi:hypothetical protein